MRIFLTGANGFIGSHLINYLLQKNHKVTALRRSNSKENLIISPEFNNWLDMDLLDLTSKELDNIDVIIHLASVGLSPRKASWQELERVNIKGTLNLCRIAKDLDARIICAGSYAEYGLSSLRYQFIPVNAPLEPTFPYAASKASAGLLAISYSLYEGIEMAYLRIFNAYGEGQYYENLWPSLRKAAASGKDFKMTYGEQIRDFISIQKVCYYFLKILDMDKEKFQKPFVINVASGQPQRVRDFCEYWWKSFNANGSLIVGALPYRKNEIMRYIPEINKDFKFYL